MNDDDHDQDTDVTSTETNAANGNANHSRVKTSSATTPKTEITAASTALSHCSDHDLRVACYCEENVWRLAFRKLHRPQHSSHYFVVFVSNDAQCVCFFHQRAAANHNHNNNNHNNNNRHSRGEPIFWDYHVILLEQQQQPSLQTLVWDIDSLLTYPCLLDEYVKHSFFDEQQQQEQPRLKRFAPLFRVIPAPLFLEHFSSDRSHMWNATKQQWNATPPTYPCIQATHAGLNNDDGTPNSTQQYHHNLMSYVDMTTHQTPSESNIYGCVLTRQELQTRFCNH